MTRGAGRATTKRTATSTTESKTIAVKPAGASSSWSLNNAGSRASTGRSLERLLQERLSLRGICRAVGVGMKWLMGFLVECYEAAPVHLNVQIPQGCDPFLVCPLEAEADELWSFVGKKTNPQWLWLALDARSRQVLAFHVGDRSRKSARQLWNQLPAVYREHSTFYTDAYVPYGRVIPQAQHRVVTK